MLAETSAELNLRTISRLSGVSVAQASRVMPALVELGIVERRDVPPSALFTFVSEHVAARAIATLADARRTVLDELGERARRLAQPPVSVIVFGSFARGDADRSSDLDVLLIRPRGRAEDDAQWRAGVDRWADDMRRFTGNRIEVLEVPLEEATPKLRGRTQLWRDIQRDGIVVYGRTLKALRAQRIA